MGALHGEMNPPQQRSLSQIPGTKKDVVDRRRRDKKLRGPVHHAAVGKKQNPHLEGPANGARKQSKRQEKGGSKIPGA